MKEKPETQQHPESEPTSLDDGESAEQDKLTEVAPLHGVPTDRDDAA